MGMGFAPTWLRQVSPLLHKTTLTNERERERERETSNSDTMTVIEWAGGFPWLMIMLMNDVCSVWTAMLCQSVRQAIAAAAAATVASNRSLARHASCFY